MVAVAVVAGWAMDAPGAIVDAPLELVPADRAGRVGRRPPGRSDPRRGQSHLRGRQAWTAGLAVGSSSTTLTEIVRVDRPALVGARSPMLVGPERRALRDGHDHLAGVGGPADQAGVGDGAWSSRRAAM